MHVHTHTYIHWPSARSEFTDCIAVQQNFVHWWKQLHRTVLHGSHTWLQTTWNMATVLEGLRLFSFIFINLYFYLNRPMWLTGTTVDGIDTARTWGLAILSWKEEKQGKLKTPEGQNAGPIPTPLCILNFRYQLNSWHVQLFHGYLLHPILKKKKKLSQVTEIKIKWQVVTNT